MADVMTIIKTSYGQADDYATKLDLIILALHINSLWLDNIDDMLVLLNELLRSSSRSQFEGAMNESHVMILFCDLELHAPASTSHTETNSNSAVADSEADPLHVPDGARSQPSPYTAHSSEPISHAAPTKLDAAHDGPGQDTPADIMNEVLRRILWLVGDKKFPSNYRNADGRMTSSSLKEILSEVNKRLPNPEEEPIACAPETSNEERVPEQTGLVGSVDQPLAEPESLNGGWSNIRRRIGLPDRRPGRFSRPEAFDEENQSSEHSRRSTSASQETGPLGVR
ncbi:uncharacterized protein B0H18DRAFT_234062 [Fomitopsis serialis]|uniref:uncharacterized protein n=1 Tax=Fomitopsis serialis TaxID=139415 RepID=UPI0020082109|nr:uncharacterized protein B0H18DRAFT_234062 [Neoantrodia serialis]KAH9928905.1 hypothetical protein B0H18DRAFT_234062 [Neoantrodia serialis]